MQETLSPLFEGRSKLSTAQPTTMQQTDRGMKEVTSAAVDVAAKLSASSGNKNLQDALLKLKPVLVTIGGYVDKLGPDLLAAWDVGVKTYTKLKPYHIDDYLSLVLGIMLIFFGGQFPVLIAGFEAYRLCGWESSKRALQALYKQYQVAMEAHKKDEKVDANKDGVADVKQITSSELITRKAALFMRVVDPHEVDAGFNGILSGLTAVVATLRMQFARTLALGASLGDIFERGADKVLRPVLLNVIPAEYHKWIQLSIVYFCRSLACTIAWWAQRIISALHSSTRGAQIVLIYTGKILGHYHITLPMHVSEQLFTPSSAAFSGACVVIGWLGLYTQVLRGFQAPFPLNILMAPLRAAEWFAWYFLASKANKDD